MGPGVTNAKDQSSTSVRLAALSLQCEPSSNIISRKRAKTEDEKEQRRIERVLRNRAAAQSSRERKRQEVDRLEFEKKLIERENNALKQQLLGVQHSRSQLYQEILRLRCLLKESNPAALDTPAPSPELACQALSGKSIKEEFEEIPFSLPSPPVSHTVDPRTSFSSANSASSPSPAPSQEEFEAGADSLDMTQHPAAVLCDLQCQSRKTRSSSEETQEPCPDAARSPSP